MGQYTSQVEAEIGVNGSRVHKIRNLELLIDLILKEFPKLNFKQFTDFFEEKKANIAAGKERPLRAAVNKRRLLGFLENFPSYDGIDVPKIIAWLGRNKIQHFFLQFSSDVDTKDFKKDEDGNWRVINPRPGSRLTKSDIIVDFICKGKDYPVKGTSTEEFGKLLKLRKPYPWVRVYRKTKSQIEMYGLLRMPPPSIKVTLWDMDLCLLKIHTGGHTREKIQTLSKKVTEAYVYLMDLMIHRGYPVGVVTFSDEMVAQAAQNPFGGEKLVRPLVFHALRRHWMLMDRTMKLEDAIKKAKEFVHEKLYVKAAFPDYRNRFDPEFKEKPMPNSKEWHISQIAVEYKKATGKSLASDEVILFDDGERNISEALKANVVAVQVDDETGFTVKDWEEAMDLAWEKY
mmetsp:Transcript_20428/g.32903  ORF Transcript_20428/g.32903 Transcript_20428/m.32903 type:complete len:401 (-) Transcript_20428:61-1263(-)